MKESILFKNTISLAVVILLLAGCGDGSGPPYSLNVKRLLPSIEQPRQIIVCDVDGDRSNETTLVFGDSVRIMTTELVEIIGDFRIPPGVNRLRWRRPREGGEPTLAFTFKRGNEILWSECTITGEIIRESVIVRGEDLDADGRWDGNVGDFEFVTINDDDVPDVVFMLVSNYDSLPRGLLGVDGRTSEPLWDFSIGSLPEKILVRDVNGDGEEEILLSTTAPGYGVFENGYDDYHSYLILLNRRGGVIWSKEIAGKYSGCLSTTIIDIDGDGQLEIVFLKQVSSAESGEDDAIFIIDAKSGDIEKFLSSASGYLDTLIVEDLDNDNELEIIASTERGSIVIYNRLLDIEQSRQLENDKKYMLHYAKDIDEDGRKDFFALSYENELAVFNYRLEMIATEDLDRYVDEKEGVQLIDAGAPSGGPGRLYLKSGNLYGLQLTKKISATMLELQPLAVIVSSMLLAALIVGILRKSIELERRKRLIDGLIGSNADAGIIILDERKRVEQVSDDLDLYCGPVSEDFFAGKEGSSDPCLSGMRSLLTELEKTTRPERACKGVLLQRGDKTLRVDFSARRITSGRGRLLGYLLMVRNSSVNHMLKLAAGNVCVGQELMHKIKTLISVYKNDLYLLHRRADGGRERGERGEIIEEMLSVTDDINSVAKGFLELSKIDGGEFQQTDLNGMIREIVSYYTKSNADGIGFDLELDESLPPASVEPGQFRSLLMNLVENAVKAVGERGRITLRLERMRRLAGGRGIDVDEYYVITVEDDGCGIDEQYQDRIFEPGFSHFSGKVGLGLTISKRIVDNHGGEILVMSKPGKGTVVTVRLPYRR